MQKKSYGTLSKGAIFFANSGIISCDDAISLRSLRRSPTFWITKQHTKQSVICKKTNFDKKYRH